MRSTVGEDRANQPRKKRQRSNEEHKFLEGRHEDILQSEQGIAECLHIGGRRNSKPVGLTYMAQKVPKLAIFFNGSAWIAWQRNGGDQRRGRRTHVFKLEAEFERTKIGRLKELRVMEPSNLTSENECIPLFLLLPTEILLLILSYVDVAEILTLRQVSLE